MFIPLPILFLLVSLLITGWLFFFDCRLQFWKLSKQFWTLVEESRKFANDVKKLHEENEGSDD